MEEACVFVLQVQRVLGVQVRLALLELEGERMIRWLDTQTSHCESLERRNWACSRARNGEGKLQAMVFKLKSSLARIFHEQDIMMAILG